MIIQFRAAVRLIACVTTATEKLNQDINRAMTHPIKLKGILDATIATSHISLYAKNNINNMIKITVGTTIFKVFFALN